MTDRLGSHRPEVQRALLLEQLKRKLWTMYGTEEHPSEWDGRVSGDGKLSQRFWEYFVTLEHLELDQDAVLLDLGGWRGFLATVVRDLIRGVVILDPRPPAVDLGEDVEYVRQAATTDVLREVLPQVTHVASISGFGRAGDAEKRRVLEDVNRYFRGGIIALTVEFHPAIRYLQFQDTRSLSAFVSPLSRFYLKQMASSPIAAVDTYYSIGSVGNSKGPLAFERWRPLALQFASIAP